MDTRKMLRTAAKAALFSVPVILGLIGFADLYRDFWSRLYHTMALFALNFNADEEYLQAHKCLQVARLFAGAATFSVVIAILNNFWSAFSAFVQVRLFKAVVVHGEGGQAARITEGLEDSGLKAVTCNSRLCFRAKNQVLAFDTDTEALRYVDAHLRDFFPRGSREGTANNIVLCSSRYSNSECRREYFSVYNPAETCARLYWSEHWLDRCRFAGGPDRAAVKKVAIIGFGCFGEQMLSQALIMNVTDRQLELTEEDRPLLGSHWDRIREMEGISYSVFGSDGADYCAMHPMLSEFLNLNGAGSGHRDSLSFFPSLAGPGIPALAGMDRIIIALDDPEACLEMMNRLICAGLSEDIHIHCANEEILFSLYRTEANGFAIVPYGMNRVLYNRENLLHEQMEQAAKALNFEYAKESLGRAVSPAEEIRLREDSWRKLTGFQKMSNFANCDHIAIKKGLMACYPFSENEDSDTANLLMEIEHTRWERFYWFHNWAYDPRRDDAKRRHPCLVPFAGLSRADQLKDYHMYRRIAEGNMP